MNASPLDLPIFHYESPGDAVNHPAHYNAHPSGVECLTIVRHMNFNIGNVIKYCWRAGLKSDDALQDLRKARFYLDDEIRRLQEAVDARQVTVIAEEVDGP